MWKKIWLVLGMICLLPIGSYAADVIVTLGWDANTESHLKGYRLHRGQSSRMYTETVDVGNVIEFSWPVPDGIAYYYAATAYGECWQCGQDNNLWWKDAQGINQCWMKDVITWECVSDYSNEIVFIATADILPNKPNNIKLILSEIVRRNMSTMVKEKEYVSDGLSFSRGSPEF